MDITPQVFTAKVMHKRLTPKANQFNYGIYYLALPLSQLHHLSLGWVARINRPALHSVFEKDHGARDGSALDTWIKSLLSRHGLHAAVDDIVLLTMPRVLGYVFNPVSFWLCLDRQRQLRAVLCEVNNTFGETHSYLCRHADHRPITANDWLDAEKVFHVSPFLPRNGHYRFRFALTPDHLAINIDYHDQTQHKQLLTSLSGTLHPLNRATLMSAFARHPLVTFKAIALIHWQAVRLLIKGIGYNNKPPPVNTTLTTTEKITEN